MILLISEDSLTGVISHADNSEFIEAMMNGETRYRTVFMNSDRL